MAITGIDGVVYGVNDMEKSRKYFADWGLRKAKSGKTESILTTANGAEVLLRTTAKDMPPAIEHGATLREIVWRVSAKKDLRDIEKELSKDREVTTLTSTPRLTRPVASPVTWLSSPPTSGA